MKTAKLLNESQAKAVYSAMVALNDIGGIGHVRIVNGLNSIHVKEYIDEEIHIWHGDIIGNSSGGNVEKYKNQAEFAEAYGLNDY